MSQFFVRDDGIVIYYVDYPDLPWPAAPVSAEQKKKFEVLVDEVRKLHKEFAWKSIQ